MKCMLIRFKSIRGSWFRCSSSLTLIQIPSSLHRTIRFEIVPSESVDLGPSWGFFCGGSSIIRAWERLSYSLCADSPPAERLSAQLDAVQPKQASLVLEGARNLVFLHSCSIQPCAVLLCLPRDVLIYGRERDEFTSIVTKTGRLKKCLTIRVNIDHVH